MISKDGLDLCPCQECEKRNVGCHTVCQEYKNWRKSKDKKHKEYLEKNRANYEYECYIKSRQSKQKAKKILSEKEKHKIFRNI